MGAVAELLHEIRSWRKSAGTSRRQLLRDRPLDQERPDPTPVAIPIGYQQPDTMEEMVQQYVRREMSAYAQTQDMGTFEEEDDFEETDSEEMGLSGYEVHEYDMAPEEPEPDASPPEAAPEPPEAPADPPELSEGTEPTDASK